MRVLIVDESENVREANRKYVTGSSPWVCEGGSKDGGSEVVEFVAINASSLAEAKAALVSHRISIVIITDWFNQDVCYEVCAIRPNKIQMLIVLYSFFTSSKQAPILRVPA